MNVWIIFLRGINVGGRNIVPMAELRKLLEKTGCTQVDTYIQSGNVVLLSACDDADILKTEIQASIVARFSFEPQVLVMTLVQLSGACRRNPFPQGVADPKILHLFFLSGKPTNPDPKKLMQLQGKTERFALIGNTFYLYAPDGIGRSKLAAGVEKSLGVPTTARNWRTVSNVLKLAENISEH